MRKEIFYSMTDKFGFHKVAEQTIAERDTIATLYRHENSGGTLLVLDNDDTNKAFCISFKTPTNSSNGIPHIIEHSVLCGSEKYPLKEPFIELVKGSLNTFLNAFTGSSETYYPVASQNERDLFNLVDVYLDAVFKPNLSEQTLAQEGWHFDLDDTDAVMTIKGIVYNEMKGAYGSASRLVSDLARRSLFPDNCYRNDAGGDPREIPNLSWSEFEKFHTDHYHPSNAFAVWYGDNRSDERFSKLNDYFSQFHVRSPLDLIPIQQPFAELKRVSSTFATEPDKTDRCYVALSWVTGDSLSSIELLTLHILRHILVGTAASPLRVAVAESGFIEDVSAGLDNNRQSYMVISLKGVETERRHEAEALVRSCLATLATSGIDKATAEASFNSVDFSLRENNSGSFPRGLSLAMAATEAWEFGADVFEHMRFSDALEKIDMLMKEGGFFESTIQRCLIDNPHSAVIELLPDPDRTKRELDEEQARVNTFRENMTSEQVAEAVKATHTLRQLQDTPDDEVTLRKLPKLRISDLDIKNKVTESSTELIGDTTLYGHRLNTDGIAYIDLGFDLRGLDSETTQYASLFGRCMLELGTSRHSYLEIIQAIGRDTGGIHKQMMISGHQSSKDAVARLFLRAKSTIPKVPALLDIISEILTDTSIDQQVRFRQMVLEEKARIEASLIPSGSHYVDSRMRSYHSESGWLSERLSGIDYLLFLRKLVTDIDHSWHSVLEKLNKIKATVVTRDNLICNITIDPHAYDAVSGAVTDLIQILPNVKTVRTPWLRSGMPINDGLSLPSQVNYVGIAADLRKAGYQWSGTIGAVLNYIQTSYLWDKIRMQGGAYGASCRYDPYTGIIGFSSYRDPNTVETIEAYKRSAKFLTSLNLDQEEVDSAIIGLIGDMDAYQLPDARGFTNMARKLTGDTDEKRQLRREQAMRCTVNDFHDLGDYVARALEEHNVCIMGSPEVVSSTKLSAFGLKLTRVM